VKVPVLLDKMVLLKEKKEREQHEGDGTDEPTTPRETARGDQTSAKASASGAHAQKDSKNVVGDASAVLQSWGFAETSQPTGVVHLAPGCGPEGNNEHC
jgi:hypothetical protein